MNRRNKRKTSVSISETTDRQLMRIINLVGCGNSRSKAIEYLAQQFIADWAVEEGIELETLVEMGEFREGEKSMFSGGYTMPSLAEAKEIAEAKKARRKELEVEKQNVYADLRERMAQDKNAIKEREAVEQEEKHGGFDLSGLDS